MHPVENNKRRGVAAIEFALCATFLIPLFFGMFTFGISLCRSVQATQVSRDAGHMFVRYTDFSLDANKDIIVRVAEGLNMTRNGGDGVVILSKIRYVAADDCELIGMASGACANVNQPVIVQRLYIGNEGLYASPFGTPSGSAFVSGSPGEIDPVQYLNNPALRANGFNAVLLLQSSELAYVSEAFFRVPELAFVPSVGAGVQSLGGRVYARTIF